MLIEKILPEFIQAKSDMRQCLIEEAKKIAIPDEEFEKIISYIPANFLNIKCFLDGPTGLWRYEFGHPSYLKKTNRLLYGTHIWPPVKNFLQALNCAYFRLSPLERKLEIYLYNLLKPEKHLDYITEIIPLFRVNKKISAEYEVPSSNGKVTKIDWRLGPIENRCILLEVKNRMYDLYEYMDTEKNLNIPQHNPALLFRNVEKKFTEQNSEQNLQGVWINTQVKLNYWDLRKYIDNNINRNKIHFIILGNDETEAFIVAKSEEDKVFLEEVFQIKNCPEKWVIPC